MSVTLATARTEVSKRAEEILIGVATGGSTTTVVDTNNLTASDGFWDEANIFFTSGTNSGLERRVLNFSASTLTLYSAVTASVANGDTYELRRRFKIIDIDTGINRALNIGAMDFREHVRVDVTATGDTYTYAVPLSSNPEMLDRGLIAIEYGDTMQVPTRPLPRLSPDLYDITEDYVVASNSNVKTLTLKFNPFTGHTIRFIFDGPLANVSVSTDRIHLDLPQLEWLYTQAATEVWRIEASRTSDASRKSALEQLAHWEAAADRLRRQLGMVRKQAPLRRTYFRVTGV